MEQENKFVLFMKKIWPGINKFINGGLYMIFTFLKTNTKRTIQQIFQR